jgi:hypothetical protein
VLSLLSDWVFIMQSARALLHTLYPDTRALNGILQFPRRKIGWT